MKMKFALLLILGLWCITGDAAKDRYDGFKVYRMNPSSQKQIDLLLKLQDAENNLDFWTEVNLADLPVDVMVSPREQRAFVSLMEQNGMQPAVYIEDVQKLFENEKVGNLAKSGRMTWTSYYRVADINSWLDSLAVDYPGVVTVINAGKSYENRDIKGVKISFKTGKRNVFIEGGIHAREWIAPATVTYIINEVLTSTDPTFRKIAESFDWYIFPSTNPDGYEFSHTTTRLWRKTRTPYGTCAGADPNRNWDFFWGVEGTSTSACSDTYGGPRAFSEKETSGLADYIKTVVPTMDVYLAFHSYSQIMLMPYGHTAQHLENYDDVLAIGKKAAESLASRYGTQYKVGNTAEILYKCSGTSMDWVKYEYKVPISYTYELRDTGRYGFALPADQIIPNCLEVMDSLVTIFLEAEKLGYFVLG